MLVDNFSTLRETALIQWAARNMVMGESTESRTRIVKHRLPLAAVALVALFAAVWCFAGFSIRNRYLADNRESYEIAKQARVHPIIARLVAPESAVRAAERFSLAYEGLQDANMLSALLYCLEFRSAARDFNAAVNGADEPTPAPTPAPAAPDVTGSGVQVVTVTPSSAAAIAGVQVGDQIIAYDGKPVSSTDELKARINSALVVPMGPVPLLIVRNGQQFRLSIQRGTMGITSR